MMWHLLHSWELIPLRNQRVPVYRCRVCGKSSWECRWFPDRFRW